MEEVEYTTVYAIFEEWVDGFGNDGSEDYNYTFDKAKAMANLRKIADERNVELDDKAESFSVGDEDDGPWSHYSIVYVEVEH